MAQISPSARSGDGPDGRRSTQVGRARTLVGNALRGMLMGSADIIPGVSGGTVALILGIYERLVDTIHEVGAGGVALLRGDRADARTRWGAAEFALIVPLGVGIVLALGIGSLVLPPLIEAYPVVTSALFFGLIAGAIPIPWRRMSRHRGLHYGLALVGAIVAFALTGIAPRDVSDPSLLLVFGAAAIAICAMILPGVSGAYLLLVLGMYELTLEAASTLDLAYLGVFALGAATGLAVFSRALSWLLDHRHDATMAVLVGLMAGALRTLWPWQTDVGALQPPPDAGAALVAVLAAVVGVAAIVALAMVGGASSDERADGSDERDVAVDSSR